MKSLIACILLASLLIACSDKKNIELESVNYSCQEVYVGDSKGIAVICSDDDLAYIKISIINSDSNVIYSHIEKINKIELDGIYVVCFPISSDIDLGFYQVLSVELGNTSNENKIFEMNLLEEEIFEIQAGEQK